MTVATEGSIGDRLYAINQTLSGIKARRYMPQNYADTALHPLALAFPGAATYDRARLYESMERVTRTWTLAFIVGTFEGGLPTESALRNSEALMETVRTAYSQRDRLQLTGSDNLSGLISAQLQSDSGIYENEGLARVDFPILVIYDRELTLL